VEARPLGFELMGISEIAVVTNVDENGFPNTRAMFNLRRKEQFPDIADYLKKNEKDFTVYFSTNTSSRKIAELKQNPKVSVYYSFSRKFRGLMLRGEMETVLDAQIRENVWQAGWEMYYPDGAQDQDHTILRLFPVFAKYYDRLEICCFYPNGENR
jgi:general stress protein 26